MGSPRPPYIVSLDIGTTNIKAALIDSELKIVRVGRERSPFREHGGRVSEHEPRLLLRKAEQLVRSVSKGYGGEVEALTISSYICGLIALDRNHRELTGLITWADARSEAVLGELWEKHDPREIYERTGCPPLHMYLPPRIWWMRKTIPRVSEDAALLLGSKSYFILNLLGQPYTDLAMASSTQLLNIRGLRWDGRALEVAGVGEEVLPIPVEGGRVLDTIPGGISSRLGLGPSVSLVPSVFDGASFILGLGCHGEGVGASHIGTSSMLRVSSREPVIDRGGMEIQCYYLMEGRWIPGGSVGNAGILLEWLAEGFGVDVEEILREVAGIDVGPDSPISIPLLVPERTPLLAGREGILIHGLRVGHGLPHLAHSLLLGFTLLLRRIKENLAGNGLRIGEIRVAGGGSRNPHILQLISDMLGVPVRKPVGLEEAGLVGNAVAAFKALGYMGLDEWSPSGWEEHRPRPGSERVSERLYERFGRLLDCYLRFR